MHVFMFLLCFHESLVILYQALNIHFQQLSVCKMVSMTISMIKYFLLAYFINNLKNKEKNDEILFG